MTFSHENEQLLDGFRRWLDDAFQQADDVLADAPWEEWAESPESSDVGLAQLAATMTALRHELKLHTRGGRTLEERTAEAVAAIGQAVGTFRNIEPAEAKAARDAARPLVESLCELHEALARGRTVIENAQQRIAACTGRLADELDRAFRAQSIWKRWLTSSWYRQTQDICRCQGSQTHQQVFASLIEGYDLIARRMKRAMQQAHLERIACVGGQVDPRTMNVVELVDDPGTPPGCVVDEVRPGYTWRGEVIRFAEVRARAERKAAESSQRQDPVPVEHEGL